MEKYKRYHTVTDGCVVKDQPICSTSVTTSSAAPGAILNVYRHYNQLRNQWGGFGRIKALDGNGKHFETAEAAWIYAYEHGYIRVYFTDATLRARRKERHA